MIDDIMYLDGEECDYHEISEKYEQQRLNQWNLIN